MATLSRESCRLFEQPFFQFAQMKKYCPEQIPAVKADFKRHWDNWKAVILQVSASLSANAAPFAKPHIESWTNGWQVRSHFFAFFKYECHLSSAAIFSVILNRRRLSVSLDWHSYRAARSLTTLTQFNQWHDELDFARYADFDLWQGDESEYADFRKVADFPPPPLPLASEQDFWCIGKNADAAELDHLNAVQFITDNIQALQALYEKCHLPLA